MEPIFKTMWSCPRLTDITDIRTKEGWLYLAVVIDRFARKIIGWAMRADMKADLPFEAPENGYTGPKAGRRPDPPFGSAVIRRE